LDSIRVLTEPQTYPFLFWLFTELNLHTLLLDPNESRSGSSGVDMAFILFPDIEGQFTFSSLFLFFNESS